MTVILDGKKTAQEIKNEIAEQVEDLKSKGKKIPNLAAVLVGENPASETYVRGKIRACEEVGFQSTLKRFNTSVTEEDLIKSVREINEDIDIDGLIVQLPLPEHIPVEKVTDQIKPEKDVDGFHPVNVGRMAKNLPAYIAATPHGILELIKRYEIPTDGKHCVVIGRSEIVGSPMSMLMARKTYPGNCTVTVCHSRTKNLKEISLQGDIIIAALGKPEFLTADMVKEGAAVVDVGITRVKDDSRKSGYALKGDVKFDEVSPKCSYITPVPGGVGPMTIASLLWNTLLSATRAIY